MSSGTARFEESTRGWIMEEPLSEVRGEGCVQVRWKTWKEYVNAGAPPGAQLIAQWRRVHHALRN